MSVSGQANRSYLLFQLYSFWWIVISQFDITQREKREWIFDMQFAKDKDIFPILHLLVSVFHIEALHNRLPSAHRYYLTLQMSEIQKRLIDFSATWSHGCNSLIFFKQHIRQIWCSLCFAISLQQLVCKYIFFITAPKNLIFMKLISLYYLLLAATVRLLLLL